MLSIGIVGTSWWTDSMYLPALADHPEGRVTALCGRDRAKAQALADRWGVPDVFTDWQALLADGGLDGVIVASANDTHMPITEAAIQAGLHVICEKPLALGAAEAERVAALAGATDLCTMVPFTYAHMPMFAASKRLIDEGFVGDVYHLNFRYFAGGGRNTRYHWRYDRDIAGSGVVGDLGSHALYYADWLAGPITEIGCVHRNFVEHDPAPHGLPYTPVEDSALLTVAFSCGGIGTLQVCAVSWEGTPFGQTHHLDLHGSDGTVYGYCDWDRVQQVRALASGEAGPAQPVDLSPQFPGVRLGSVHDTYRDVFRTTDVMARRWVSDIAAGRRSSPDLAVGARVQRMIDTALRSASEGSRLIPVQSSAG